MKVLLATVVWEEFGVREECSDVIRFEFWGKFLDKIKPDWLKVIPFEESDIKGFGLDDHELTEIEISAVDGMSLTYATNGDLEVSLGAEKFQFKVAHEHSRLNIIVFETEGIFTPGCVISITEIPESSQLIEWYYRRFIKED
jgi:hypothetical protein